VPGAAHDADEVRDELGAWVLAAWDPELSLEAWRERLCDAGWMRPSWPTRWCGRDLPSWAGDLVDRVLADAGAVGGPDGVGAHLVAPTVLEHGPDEVRERLLRRTLTGALRWCQLFSEPGAGSDLAGLTTHARRDGDEWVVRGQKVWTTSAHHADVGLLLARTNWDVPKHEGITCFALEMRQPGVEVRPLRQMNGHASFNEVFLDDARVGIDDVIGEVDRGWQVAMTTLAHERRLASLTRGVPRAGEPTGRVVREAIEESLRASEPYRWYPQRAGRVDLLVPLASSRGADATARDAVTVAVATHRVGQLTSRRAAAARAAGRSPGPEGSIGKLTSSEVARRAAVAHTRLAGAQALLDGPGSHLDGVVAEVLVSVPAVSIAGGTDEIQRTILAERVLGLPKEPEDARTLPFRSFRTSGATPEAP